MLVPMAVDRQALDPARDIYPDLLGQRIVFLGGVMDAAAANLVAAQLIHLESVDPDRSIDLYVNSPGGEASSMMTIYDTMQRVRPDVATTCIGRAASAAAVVFAAGAPGRRTMLPHARILMGRPQLPKDITGPAVDLDIYAREAQRQKDQMIAILARHTGQHAELIRGDMERDRWLSAVDAVAYGLADEVLVRANPASLPDSIP